jgi:hypothetical protein
MHAVCKWEKAGFGEVPLMITSSRISGPKTRPLEISIAVPILNSWIRDSPIFIARSVSFQNMVRSLNRVLAHPSDILNFKFYSARELETVAESVMGAIYQLIAVTKEIIHHEKLDDMIEEMVNETSPEKLQLLTLMRRHPQVCEEVLREMVSKFHDPLAWLRPYVGKSHGGVTLDLQNVDRLVFFHEDSKDSTDDSRLTEVWEEFRKFRRACRDTRPVRGGWMA